MKDTPILGLIGSTAQWVFCRDNILSVTVSAAHDLASRSADEVAALIWSEVSAAMELPVDHVPPVRVIKEKRATFVATADQLLRRPEAGARHGNLFVAGDWTDTGLPATIEGAIRSGEMAANAVSRWHS